MHDLYIEHQCYSPCRLRQAFCPLTLLSAAESGVVVRTKPLSLHVSDDDGIKMMMYLLIKVGDDRYDVLT